MNEPMIRGTKVCATCGEEKPALAFAANRERADGLQADCRECVARRSAVRRAERKVAVARKNREFGPPGGPKR